MSAVLDRVLLGVDLLLLGGVVAVGVMGEKVPLSKGLDVLALKAPAELKPIPPPSPPPEPPPAPDAPQPAPPAPTAPEPPKPGAAEYGRALQAKARAQGLMGEAHEAPVKDPGKKRRAYTQAEEALKEAIREYEAWKALRPDMAATADAEMTTLRSLIMECHKSKPMEIK